MYGYQMQEARRDVVVPTPRSPEAADNLVNEAMELIGRILQDVRLNLQQTLRLYNSIYAFVLAGGDDHGRDYFPQCYAALKEVLERHADIVVRVRLEALLDDNAGQGPRPNIFTLMAPLLREFKRKVGRIARLASPLNRYCMSERGRDRGFEPSILDLGLRVFREKVVNSPAIRQRIQAGLAEEGMYGVGHTIMSELGASDLV